jgi:hypothetical protein
LALGRAGLDAEHHRDVFVRVALDVVQHQYFPESWSDRRERPFDVDAIQRLAPWLAVTSVRIIERNVVVGFAQSLLPKTQDEPGEPRSQPRSPFELCEALHGAHPRVVNEVLGDIAVTGVSRNAKR